MPPKSSIKSLPKKLLDEVQRLLVEEWSLDDLVAYLREAGHERSRSALGRYKRDLGKVAERMRRSREMAGALVREMGPQAAEGKTGRLLVEILQSIVFNHLIKLGDAEEGEDGGGGPNAMDLMLLAKSIGEMTRALKVDADREAQLKKQWLAEQKQKLDQIEKEAQDGMPEGTAVFDPATLNRVREILGVRALPGDG